MEISAVRPRLAVRFHNGDVIGQGAGSRTGLSKGSNPASGDGRSRQVKRRQGANRRKTVVSQFGPSGTWSSGNAAAIGQAECLTIPYPIPTACPSHPPTVANPFAAAIRRAYGCPHRQRQRLFPQCERFDGLLLQSDTRSGTCMRQAVRSPPGKEASIRRRHALRIRKPVRRNRCPLNANRHPGRRPCLCA
ncbi:hypothetical protein PMI07_005450 [Rhizobium sp. CF080]|nr:hypothetical protein PMI07_005450 [Rhizobium sp. CF080]